MDINELKNTTNTMMCNFINELGLNGNYYSSLNSCPIVYGKLDQYDLFIGDTILVGRFFPPKNKELKAFLEDCDFSPEDKKKYFEDGLIVINEMFKDKPVNKLLLITCIHERYHSNRMILTEPPYSGNEDIDDLFYVDNHFVRNSEESKEKYIDPAQEIILGSIDQSKDIIHYYQNLPFNKKDDLQFDSTAFDDKKAFQYAIDETLIDLMARITYELSTKKYASIMDVLKDLNDNSKKPSFRAMSNIILKHNDLELFKWMIDPLSYQVDDIHYDFFLNYVSKDDFDDINTILETEDVIIDENFLDTLKNKASDIKFK